MKINSFFFSLCVAFFVFMTISASAAGVPDPSFGVNGSVQTQVGSFTGPVKILVQPDQKIVVLGNFSNSGSLSDTFVARYLPNGVLDPAFGTNGISIVAFSSQSESANDLILQPDGKMVIVGSLFSPTTQSNDFFIARLNTNGTTDSSFGTNGITTINQSSVDSFNAAAIAPDGKIVAVGSTSQNGGEATMVRFLPNGALDVSFAQQGLAFVNYPNFTNDSYRTVTILPDVPPGGRILVGGDGFGANARSFIASRYYIDGSACQGFGENCTVFTSSGPTFPSLDVEVQPDGKILTVSDSIRRFLANGEPDPSFTANGAGSRLALRPDGRFVVAGSFLNSNTTGIYSPIGRRIGRAVDGAAIDVAIQSDGKILTLSASQTTNALIIKRLNAITSRRNSLVDFDDDEKSDLAHFDSSVARLTYLSSNAGISRSYFLGESAITSIRIIPAKVATLPFPYTYWRSFPAANPQGFFCSAESGSTNRQCFQWGIFGDIPLTGDFDGDDRNDAVVFRPSDGVWYISQSSDNQFRAIRWGQNGDKPVPADYDYDGITDFAIFRPSTGTWWVSRSSDDGYFTIPFGVASDIPLTGDFDGDGRADFTVYRASEGNWYQFLTSEGYRVVRFGLPADFPVPGDYDGDGRHDIAVFRKGVWYLLQSTAGLRVTSFGTDAVQPVAVRYDQ